MPQVERKAIQNLVSIPLRPKLFNQRSQWSLICIAAIAWSLTQTGLFRQDVINSGGWSLFLRFLVASLHPDLSPELLSLTLDATLVTLAYAICGTALSVLLGLIGGVLASQVWWQSVFLSRTGKILPGYKVPWLSIRALLSIPRAIHEMIWGCFSSISLGLIPWLLFWQLQFPLELSLPKFFPKS